MFGVPVFPDFLVVAAGIGGLALGALLVRVIGSAGHRPLGRGADDLHHKVRALEADLRVAHRSVEHAKAEQEQVVTALAAQTSELNQLREQAARHDDEVRKLKTAVQHECGKTARLRHELADRAEEMVRTHVQLRDVQTELGVSQVGSDVVIDQITRLERERDDLNAMVTSLRREMEARKRRETAGLPDNDLLLDC